jgi:hypothetical protein
MEALRVRHPRAGVFESTKLFETVLRPLANAAQPPRFRF